MLGAKKTRKETKETSQPKDAIGVCVLHYSIRNMFQQRKNSSSLHNSKPDASSSFLTCGDASSPLLIDAA
jgi:uncharacterized membrane protein YebE (DUF533 family)